MENSQLENEPVLTYLGLGSNLGDRMNNLESAVERLSDEVSLRALSSVYETDPVGYKEQPLFLNAVLSGETRLGPLELLRFVKDIERALGRKDTFHNGPRIIDIDILFYGDLVIKLPDLIIPHPRVARRAFMLVPLSEISSKMIHPVNQRRIIDLLSDVSDFDSVKQWGRLTLKGTVG